VNVIIRKVYLVAIEAKCLCFSNHFVITNLFLINIIGSVSNRKELNKQTPWSEFASELYRPSDCSLSAKLLPTFEDIGCHVVSVTHPYGRILGFLDRRHYFVFKVAPQLYSRG
jgi:hypothetical protein